MKNRLIVTILALFAGVSLMGCNTISGVGKDLQRAGEKIEGAAKK